MKNNILILISTSLVLFNSGCSVRIETKPDAYPFPSEQVFNVRSGVAANITNFYTNPEEVEIARNVFCDLQHFTDTARMMVQRELQMKGVEMRAYAEKTVILKMTSPSWVSASIWSVESKVTLQATLGNGEIVMIDAVNRTSGNAMRAFNGAILKAVTGLLQDKVFAAYMNQS